MGFFGKLGDFLNKVDESISSDPHIVGKRFEDHVESLFSTKWFTVVEKTHSAKVNQQRYVESSLNPDLIFRYNGPGGGTFAVECKYRSPASFNKKGMLELFKPGQLERYRKFSVQRNIPVFVVIELDAYAELDDGKVEDGPFMFNIPLCEIRYDALYPSVLEKFERPFDKPFFWREGQLYWDQKGTLAEMKVAIGLLLKTLLEEE